MKIYNVVISVFLALILVVLSLLTFKIWNTDFSADCCCEPQTVTPVPTEQTITPTVVIPSPTPTRIIPTVTATVTSNVPTRRPPTKTKEPTYVAPTATRVAPTQVPPTQVPPTSEPPINDPTPEPKATKHPNNGGGNGSEGSSPSDKGNDDETTYLFPNPEISGVFA